MHIARMTTRILTGHPRKPAFDRPTDNPVRQRLLDHLREQRYHFDVHTPLRLEIFGPIHLDRPRRLIDPQQMGERFKAICLSSAGLPKPAGF